MSSRLLNKLSRRLLDQPDEQQQFMQALTDPQPLHPCILWSGDRPHPMPFAVEPCRPEQPIWVDRLPLEAQPGKHPLHEKGAYYCLDYTSALAASVLQAIPTPTHQVIDLCAAPGGKSLFAWRSLQPRWLLSNDVIRKRLAPLISNLKRCGAYAASSLEMTSAAGAESSRSSTPHVADELNSLPPMSVASQDPAILAQHLTAQMDVVIVDAPCTGQSLLAKGGKADGCFHPVTINKNANRQKRIVANAVQMLRPEGYLAYMTCAFSWEENEAVLHWLLKKYPTLKPVSVPHLAAFRSRQTEMPCYRFWPQSGLGAGGFSCLLQKHADSSPFQDHKFQDGEFQDGEAESAWFNNNTRSHGTTTIGVSDAVIEQLDIRPIYLR